MSQELRQSSQALQHLAQLFFGAAKEGSDRIKGNLRLEALQKESTVTERFWAYMEVGLDKQILGDDPLMRVTAVAFTDRADSRERISIGADMACFIRYDLPGLRWAKGFLGQSKLAKVHGVHPNGVPRVGLPSPENYDQLIQQCTAMGGVTDESYVFFFSTESVTVEKANNLLGDFNDHYPQKPWDDIHQFRQEAPVNIAQFYAAMAACQLGESMLDRPAYGDQTVIDLIRTRNIETVLLLMVGTTPPQRPLRRDSAEAKALPVPVPETYWLFPQLMHTLTNR
jgi:hypothetical protein